MRVRECLRSCVCVRVCVSWRSHYISSDYSSTLFLCVLLASRAFTLLVHLISTKLGQWQQLLLLVPLTRPRRRQQLTDSVTPCVASSHSLRLAVSAALLINECIHEYFSGAYLNLKTTLGSLWLRGTGRQAGSSGSLILEMSRYGYINTVQTFPDKENFYFCFSLQPFVVPIS